MSLRHVRKPPGSEAQRQVTVEDSVQVRNCCCGCRFVGLPCVHVWHGICNLEGCSIWRKEWGPKALEVCMFKDRVEGREMHSQRLKSSPGSYPERRKFRKIPFHQRGRMPRSGHCIALSQWSVGKSQIAGQSEWVDRRTEVCKRWALYRGWGRCGFFRMWSTWPYIYANGQEEICPNT